jgi:DNA-binding transcriptional LysR family regulator
MALDPATMLDWNDLRYFLAVAREGSTLAAGRAMRVSQTTVARRISALENSLGFPLFEKRQAGYALTPLGNELFERAEQVERAANRFVEAAAAQSRDISGSVKITTEEVYAITLLASLLRELHEAHPEIHIELDTSQTVRDLGAGEADISLRSTKGQQPAGLVGRQLCIDDWTLYCSRDYAARHGVPRTAAELRQHSFIGGGGGHLWLHYQAWLKELGLEEQVAMHHATSGGLLSGIRSGFGIAVLPCIVADADPELVRCVPPRRNHDRTLWLLTHERVRHTPRVRAVIDFLYDRLSGHVRRLETKAAAA